MAKKLPVDYQEALRRIQRNFRRKKLELDLSELNIDELPKDIIILKNLQELHIEATQISELPTEISELENLQLLSLEDSPIRDFPSEILKLKNGFASKVRFVS